MSRPRNETTEQAERRRAAGRLRYARHAEEIKAWQRDYRTANAAKMNAQARARRVADPEHVRALARARYAANRDKINARNKEIRDRDKDRATQMLRKHGLRPDELAEMWSAQDGRCYLCGDLLLTGPRQTVVDHVHDCCGLKSCDACRRGLACASCNKIIGFARDDPERLRHIADSLVVANAAARARMASKPRPEMLFV